MRDFNFFAPYQGKNKEQKDKKIYIYIVSGVLVAFIFGTLIWNTTSIIITKSQIKKYNEQINAADIQEKIKIAEELNTKTTVLNKYETAISSINFSMAKNDVVTSELLEKINSTIPKDVSFNSTSIDSTTITFKATSKTRQAIGEIQYNIKQLDNIEDVQISSISGDESDSSGYTFDLKCTLKDSDSHEDK